MSQCISFFHRFRLWAGLLLLLCFPGLSAAQVGDKEPNDSTGQASQLVSPAGTVHGEISTMQDVDFYKYTGTAGSEMIFFLRPGNGLDPILAFYTSGGHLLAYNDKEINYNTGGPAKDAVLYLKIPASGVYYVSVSSEERFRNSPEGGTIGTYSLSVWPRTFWSQIPDIYEPNDTRATATDVAIPFESNGAKLDFFGDIDWYLIQAKAGERISVDIESLEPESHPDWLMTVMPRLGVFDETGRLLQEARSGTDPDNGYQGDPAIYFDVPYDGSYFIAVAAGPDDRYGSVFSNDDFLADPYISSAENLIGSYQVRMRSIRRLFFPQIANGSFGSIYFRTSVVLVNAGDTEAVGHISFFNADGTEMEISPPSSGMPPGIVYFRIPAKGSFVFETDGNGPGTSGYAEVAVSSGVGGSAIFTEYGSGGTLITEAAVAASELLDFCVFPVDVTGDFNTGVAIANPGSGDVNVYLNLLDLSGNPVAARSVPLAAGRQMAVYVSGIGQLFPSLRNFRGSVQVLADAPVPAVALRSSSRTLTTFPAVPLNQDYNPVTLTFPQMVVGPTSGSYRSTIVLTNPGYFPASGTLTLSGRIQFRRPDGSLLTPRPDSPAGGVSYDFTVQALGALFLESVPADSLVSGYAVLTANHGIGGVVIFSLYDAAGALITEAAVPPAPTSEDFLIFAQADGIYNTGIALANTGPDQSELCYVLRSDEDPGNAVQTEPSGMAPGLHAAEMIAGENQLFPAFSGTGTLEVRSSRAIPAVALRLTAKTMTAVPVMPIVK